MNRAFWMCVLILSVPLFLKAQSHVKVSCLNGSFVSGTLTRLDNDSLTVRTDAADTVRLGVFATRSMTNLDRGVTRIPPYRTADFGFRPRTQPRITVEIAYSTLSGATTRDLLDRYAEGKDIETNGFWGGVTLGLECSLTDWCSVQMRQSFELAGFETPYRPTSTSWLFTDTDDDAFQTISLTTVGFKLLAPPLRKTEGFTRVYGNLEIGNATPDNSTNDFNLESRSVATRIGIGLDHRPETAKFRLMVELGYLSLPVSYKIRDYSGDYVEGRDNLGGFYLMIGAKLGLLN